MLTYARRTKEHTHLTKNVDISMLLYLAEQHVQLPPMCANILLPFLAETNAKRGDEVQERQRYVARLNRLENLVEVLQDRARQAQSKQAILQVANSELNTEIITARNTIVKLLRRLKLGAVLAVRN
jgi:hypothetical protein